MAEIVISDVPEEAVPPDAAPVWDRVDELRERLSRSGREFSDSAELLREDRQR